MMPKRISGATATLGAPEGWNPDRDGDVRGLAVRQVVHGSMKRCESAWEPTPAELAALNAGGLVILSCVGGQPPVLLRVEMPAPDEAGADSYARAGGPPSDWDSLTIIDEATGNAVADVIEVNCSEGWLRRWVRNGDGNLRCGDNGEPVDEIVASRFRIERRVGP